MDKIPVVMIFGPTAVGKTALLLSDIFRKSEIINADSMQVYRGMEIGTAKPEAEFLQKIKHHLIDILYPSQQFHAGDFVRMADELVPQIYSRGRIPVICGGTGFYFRNFIYGLPEAPQAVPEVRDRLQRELADEGPAVLYDRLKQADPVSARRINVNDIYRILRALEVYESSGMPLSSYSIPDRPRDDYSFLIIGLRRPRQELYERIDQRVEQMFRKGLEAEFRKLTDSGYGPDDPGMRGIGYREFFTADEKGLSTEELIELIRRNSRRYAKRQITYFRQLQPISWHEPDDEDSITDEIRNFLKK